MFTSRFTYWFLLCWLSWFAPRRSLSSKGQGLVEYALVLVLVAVVVIAILTLLGPQIGNVFSKITCGMGNCT